MFLGRPASPPILVRYLGRRTGATLTPPQRCSSVPSARSDLPQAVQARSAQSVQRVHQPPCSALFDSPALAILFSRGALKRLKLLERASSITTEVHSAYLRRRFYPRDSTMVHKRRFAHGTFEFLGIYWIRCIFCC